MEFFRSGRVILWSSFESRTNLRLRFRHNHGGLFLDLNEAAELRMGSGSGIDSF